MIPTSYVLTKLSQVLYLRLQLAWVALRKRWHWAKIVWLTALMTYQRLRREDADVRIVNKTVRR